MWVIGDVHGHRRELGELLREIGREERLVFVGDLVNGPDSVGTLRMVADLDATVCLGNHDLHMLAVWAGQRELRDKDRFTDVLDAPDADALCAWLLGQSLAFRDEELDLLVVHAGVLPCWTVEDALGYATEVESVLHSEDRDRLFATMYGNEPDRFDPALEGDERRRVLVNAFTRMRIVDRTGRMDLRYTDRYEAIPPGWCAWFDHPDRRTRETKILFGHWSALGFRHGANVACLDSGVRWGGSLTGYRAEDGIVAQVRATSV